MEPRYYAVIPELEVQELPDWMERHNRIQTAIVNVVCGPGLNGQNSMECRGFRIDARRTAPIAGPLYQHRYALYHNDELVYDYSDELDWDQVLIGVYHDVPGVWEKDLSCLYEMVEFHDELYHKYRVKPVAWRLTSWLGGLSSRMELVQRGDDCPF